MVHRVTVSVVVNTVMSYCQHWELGLLVASHVGHLVAIWTTLRTEARVPAAVLVSNLASSVVYHVYDCKDVWNESPDVLDTWKTAMELDFTTSAMAFIAVVVGLVTMHDDLVVGVVVPLVLPPLAFNRTRDTWTYLAIIASATTVALAGWIWTGRAAVWLKDTSHSHRVRVKFLALSLVALALAIVSQWRLADQHAYAVWHSVWHTSIGVAAAAAAATYTPHPTKISRRRH